jgi:hypothetical protein
MFVRFRSLFKFLSVVKNRRTSGKFENKIAFGTASLNSTDRLSISSVEFLKDLEKQM